MTLDEKLASISTAWKRLKPGSHLVVVGTPNRLWREDGHTSLLPFFNWLPDDLAMHYSQYSPREYFNDEFRPPFNDNMRLKFTRHGRAASYHEFQLAIPNLELASVSCMNSWVRSHNPLQYAKWNVSGERKFQGLLARFGRGLPVAFFALELNFSIKKDAWLAAADVGRAWRPVSRSTPIHVE